MIKSYCLILLSALYCHAANPSFSQTLDKVMSAQESSDRVKNDYCFREHRDVKAIASDGKLLKDEQTEFETIRFPGGIARRIISKNGKPLEGKELEAEERRVMKEFDESQKKPSLKSGPNLTAILKGINITSIENKAYKDSIALYLYFTPRDQDKKGDFAEDMFAKMTGYLVVDPTSYRIKHINGESNISKSFMLGVGSVSDIKLSAEYMDINNEYVGLTTLNVEAKSRALFKKFRLVVQSKLDNYKKFTVEPGTIGSSTPY